MQPVHPKLFIAVAHAVGGLVVAFALLLCHAIVFKPLDNQALLDRRKGDQLQLGLNDSLKVRRDHLQFTRYLKNLNERVAAGRQRLRGTSVESEFLTNVTQAAEAAAIDLTDYGRERREVGPQHSEIEVAMHGVGSHAEVCHFFDRLSHFPYAAVLTDLQINSTNDAGMYPFKACYTLYYVTTPRQALATPSTPSPSTPSR